MSQFNKDIASKLTEVTWTSLGDSDHSVKGILTDVRVEVSYHLQVGTIVRGQEGKNPLGLMVVVKIDDAVAASWGAWDEDIIDVITWFIEAESKAMKNEMRARERAEYVFNNNLG